MDTITVHLQIFGGKALVFVVNYTHLCAAPLPSLITIINTLSGGDTITECCWEDAGTPDVCATYCHTAAASRKL